MNKKKNRMQLICFYIQKKTNKNFVTNKLQNEKSKNRTKKVIFDNLEGENYF